MDNFLDKIWEYIEFSLEYSTLFMDKVFSPLEIAGSWFVIFALALIIVLITKLLGRSYVTKRYIRLEKDFLHWKNVREEAINQPDKEKGKALAKNIDQAKLNRVYYDYFFEGLLKSFITSILPMLLMAAYIINIYTPENLLARFGKEWVFSFSLGSSFQINISSALWFLICLISSFILYAVLKTILKKLLAKKKLDKTTVLVIFLVIFLGSPNLFATQMHKGNEGIIVHQIGHLFFLFSMVALIFTINGKKLSKERGWRLIQYSAFLFVLWNLDALAAHFLDNMIHVAQFERLSLWKVNVATVSDSSLLAIIYYILKLDHLLCVPAMFLLFIGIKQLSDIQKKKAQ